MQLDLSSIESAATGIVACTATIATRSAALKAQDEALQAANDPTAQARVNTVGQTLAQAKAALQVVSDSLSVTPPVPDPPPAP